MPGAGKYIIAKFAGKKINMLRAISNNESKQMNKELLNFFRKELLSTYGTYIFNVLIALKSFVEKMKGDDLN